MNKPGICSLPLYRQVARAIRNQLGVVYKVGDRLPTETELAEQFGVSLITIKGALAELRDQGFIISKRGSRVRVKQVNPPGWVAVLIDLDYELPEASSYYRYLIRYVSEALEAAGIDYRIYKGRRGPVDCPIALTCAKFLKDRVAGRIGSVIAICTDPMLDWYAETVGAGIPVLGCNSEYTHAVFQNSFGSMDIGFLHLISSGCRNIAVVGWDGFRGENSVYRDYYHRILSTYGVSGSNHWFKADIHPSHDGAGWEEFREIWTSHAQKPDGLLVLDGELLPGVMQAMNDFRVRPGKDIQVVSKMSEIPGFMPIEGVHYLLLDPRPLAVELVSALRDLIKGKVVGHRLVPYRFLNAADIASIPSSEVGFGTAKKGAAYK